MPRKPRASKQPRWRIHTARDIIHLCMDCGLHTIGPFTGRFDVTQEEMRVYLDQFGEGGGHGRMEPARRRKGGLVYHQSEYADGRNEPVSGGLCQDCEDRELRKIRRRHNRLRKAMGMPPLEQVAPTGTGGAGASDAGGDLPYEEQPAPSEEEARRFLLGKHEAPDDDPEGGEE